MLGLERKIFVILATLAGLACFAGVPSTAQAAVSPLGVSIASPVQFPAENYSITGLRLSALYGKQQQVYGFDFALGGNITTQKFVGLGVSGLFNYTSGQTTAVFAQLAGLANVNKNKTNVYGLQAALLANANSAETSIYGLQLAAANLSPHATINGVQAGVYNRAQKVRGIQIGLINVTDSLSGIQIGLLNFNHKGLFYVSPIVNIGF